MNVIRNFRVQKFEPGTPNLVPGKVFGLCEDCQPIVENEIARKFGEGSVLTPADYDKTDHPCHRCKATNPPPRPITRRTDPETSHEAAASLTDKQLSTLDSEITAAITKLNGATSLEISETTGRPRVSVSPRMKRLAERGIVYDSGERRVHPQTNKAGIVWKLCQNKNVTPPGSM